MSLIRLTKLEVFVQEKNSCGRFKNNFSRVTATADISINFLSFKSTPVLGLCPGTFSRETQYMYFNQSVENAGVAFVKGADERTEFFEKNKQTVIYDEQVSTNKAKD